MKNTFCWVDVPVKDLDRAISFYQAVLGENIQKFEEHGFSFGLFPHDDESVAGCLTPMDDRKPSKDGPLIYLNVEGKLDRAVANTTEHGGAVLSPKEQIGPWGHRAIIQDTEGNVIALYSKEA